MKLQNKKTGKVIELFNNTDGIFPGSLAELNAEWEDMPEEPKNPCFINWFGEVSELLGHISDREIEKLKEAGNYFETKEEAEKAVEKLKAWRRLKDKGFRFAGVEDGERTIRFEIPFRAGYDSCEAEVDLVFLFGGEE